VTTWGGATALALALALFLGSRAILAFWFEPRISDTVLYAVYAFVASDAHRSGESPYDRFERLVQSAEPSGDQPPPRFEEVTIEYPPAALALMMTPLLFVPDAAHGSGGNATDARAIAAWTHSFSFGPLLRC
jgi:hypothetical protein